MHAAVEVDVALIALLAMVGHIHHDGVLVLEALYYLVDNRVVIQYCVVVVGKHAQLFLLELGPVVVFRIKVSAVSREARAIVNVLPLQMEYYQIVLSVVALQPVIVAQQSVVVSVKPRVARVEHGVAQLRIVQEEAAAEVVDSLLSLRQKLVGKERYMISCLAEQLGEQRIVAPFAFVAHCIEREESLEHKARKIPRRHNVAERYQLTLLSACLLSWRGVFMVSVQSGMMAVVALAYYQHDILAAERAAVHLCLVDIFHQGLHLLGRKFVGIYAEHKAVAGQIQLGFLLLGQFMLHLPYVVVGHQAHKGRLVGKTLDRADHKHHKEQQSEPRLSHAPPSGHA